METHASRLSDSLTTRVTKVERLGSHLGNCGASVSGQPPGGTEKEGRYSELNLSPSVSLHLV